LAGEFALALLFDAPIGGKVVLAVVVLYIDVVVAVVVVVVATTGVVMVMMVVVAVTVVVMEVSTTFPNNAFSRPPALLVFDFAGSAFVPGHCRKNCPNTLIERLVMEQNCRHYYCYYCLH